ncbi:exported hypothetical protein [Candidatus Nitrospira nitrosa]|uniref:Uncharacterized protein n=1 Tax=Candidatus Nitrospira nitrosa TaxID=1742972 RepID=A0A0S4LHR0_9BACT|nr:hypothetical protein [Candidatus Nitrospira nitrosa]CUS37105.1 exported hypothetical protein [Candidatus Nitrospira nitrosa]
MKTHHFLCFIVCISVMHPSQALPIVNKTPETAAQENPQHDQSVYPLAPEDAAANGLKSLLKRLEPKTIPDFDQEREKHAQELGFTTGTAGAKLRQDAFPIYEVRLEDIQNFTPNKDAKKLLVRTPQLLFPIEVQNEVRSSITVRSTINQPRGIEQTADQETRWRPTRWGLPKLIARLTTERKRLDDKISRLKGFRLVSIPALNRNFLGYEDNADLKLVPLVSDHLFTAGKPLSTREVFLSLIPEAKSVDGSPR